MSIIACCQTQGQWRIVNRRYTTTAVGPIAYNAALAYCQVRCEGHINVMGNVMNVKDVDSTTSVKKDGVWKDAASYDFVRFTLCDMHGVSRSKLIPRRHVGDKLKTGIGMCSGISHTHCTSTKSPCMAHSDIKLKQSTETA